MENLEIIVQRQPQFFKTLNTINARIEEIEDRLLVAYPFLFISQEMSLEKIGDKKRWCSWGKPVADCSVSEKIVCLGKLEEFTKLLVSKFQELETEAVAALGVADTWLKQPRGTMVVGFPIPNTIQIKE